MEGRTSFIVAHRLSTIMGADLILVMKDSTIIEQDATPHCWRIKAFIIICTIPSSRRRISWHKIGIKPKPPEHTDGFFLSHIKQALRWLGALLFVM